MAGRSGFVTASLATARTERFLGVDATHAHINIPAALMWARGLEDRPVRVTFDLPAGSAWKVATQLHPTQRSAHLCRREPLVSDRQPDGSQQLRSQDISDRPRNVPACAPSRRHGPGGGSSGAGCGAHRARGGCRLRRVARVRRRHVHVPGGLSAQRRVGWHGASQQHVHDRCVGALRVPDERASILGTVSHEFFHSWNVERIRPRSLEPFDLEEVEYVGRAVARGRVYQLLR